MFLVGVSSGVLRFGFSSRLRLVVLFRFPMFGIFVRFFGIGGVYLW